MSAADLDAALRAAAARGEVLFYIPVTVRRERGPAVTFASMPAGGVK